MPNPLPSIQPPPAVPDGSVGSPMLVQKLNPTGFTLSLSWDSETCAGPGGYHLLASFGSRLPGSPGATYLPLFERCGIESPYLWIGAPDPAPDLLQSLPCPK